MDENQETNVEAETAPEWPTATRTDFVVDEPATDNVEAETPASTEDRSAYNCPACKGEGLQDQFTLCPQCNGTGKVSEQTRQYPVGTQVITNDGTYIVDEVGNLNKVEVTQ